MRPLPAAIASFLEREEPQRRLGPFQLVRPLGQGGFAPVWLARERYGEMDLRAAAVKLFSLDALGGDGAGAGRERVLAEARALCRVEHPGIVRFYALPVDEAAGVMGLAMEHLDGVTLAARIEAEGRLPLAEALAAGAMVASALAAIHRAGLAHGDVKPANIMATPSGPKLIDFGIASLQDSAAPAPPADEPQDPDSTVRLLGRAAGTPGYVDPHAVCTGAPASPAGDLYGLGATIFACLTGRVPAALRAGEPLNQAVIEGRAPPPDIEEERPDAPAELADLLRSLLDPDRSARPVSADFIASRLGAIRQELAAPRSLPLEELGPFRGLGRFEARDRDVFFGRTGEIAAALEALRGRGLLALVGASGSGKSSLARAGLLPAIQSGALCRWPPAWDTAVVEPGRDPREALTAALSPLVEGAAAMSAGALAGALAARAEAKGRGIVLLVDPLESISQARVDPGRELLAGLLAEVGAAPIPGVRAVVAARRDRLDPLLAMDRLGPALARGLFLVAPLDAAAMREAIALALAAFHYTFEDGALEEEVFQEIDAAAGAMPLIEFALAELWKKRDSAARRLTREGLRAIGGFGGALERHAEATLASLSPSERAAARGALLALTTPDGARADRSDQELALMAGPSAPAVLSAFEAARLIVPSAAEGQGPRRVTLAHEALIAQWSRLRSWVEEAREDRRLTEEIERDAARREAEPESAPLWRGRRLSYAMDLSRRPGAALSARARAFVRASVRAERRARAGVALAGAAVLLSLGAGAVLYVRAAQAERAAALAMEEAARSEGAAAQRALVAEQDRRRLAEQERVALEQKEREIERLTGDLETARTRGEALQKVREIRSVLSAAPRRPPASAAPSATAAPASMLTSATAAPPSPASSAPAPAPRIAPLTPGSAADNPAPARPFASADDWE